MVLEEFFLEGESCYSLCSSIPNSLLTTTVFPLPCTKLAKVCLQEITRCSWCAQDLLYPCKCSLGMLNIEIHQHTLWLHFLGWIYVHNIMITTDSGKKMSRKPFQLWEVTTLITGRFTICHKMSAYFIVTTNTLWVVSRMKNDFSETHPLLRKTLSRSILLWETWPDEQWVLGAWVEIPQ